MLMLEFLTTKKGYGNEDYRIRSNGKDCCKG